VLLPFSRRANAKLDFFARSLESIVGSERAPDAFVHHGKTVVCKRLIVHKTTPQKKPPLRVDSDGLSSSDHQKVTVSLIQHV
jgi:hypothetical protein